MIYFSDFGAAASAGISFVGSATFADDAIGTFNFSSLLDEAGGTPSVLSTDFVMAFFAAGSTSDRPDSVMQPTGYTLGHSNLTSANGAIVANLQMSYKFAGADTSFAYVATGGVNGCRVVDVHVFRGVNASTPLDVATTIASGTGTGAANPPSNTPSTAGAWPIVAGTYTENGDRILFTNPGDLSATTNHFRSALSRDDVRDTAIGVGLKTDWTSGAFDPSTLSGGSTDAAAAWCALHAVLRPA